jgi:hypothetical protein
MTEREQYTAELTALAKHLPGWQVEANDSCWCGSLIGGNGKGLHFNFTGKKGRMVIGGRWPQSADHQQFYPREAKQISVARNLPPEKIAADVARRFLPWYEAAYGEQVELAAKHDAYNSKQANLTDVLAALVPGSHRSTHIGNGRNEFYAVGLTVKVSGESVNIDIRYKNAKIAKAILKAYVKAGGLSD